MFRSLAIHFRRRWREVLRVGFSASSVRGREFVTETYRKHGAVNPQARFRVMIVCGGNCRSEEHRRLSALVQIASELPASIRNAVWLTTMITLIYTENILSGGIWYRVAKAGVMATMSEVFRDICRSNRA